MFSNTLLQFSVLPRELMNNYGYAINACFKTDTDKDFVHLNACGGALVAQQLIKLLDNLK